jgi:hypothetical protein
MTNVKIWFGWNSPEFCNCSSITLSFSCSLCAPMKVKTRGTEGSEWTAPAPSADTGYILVFVLQNSFYRFRFMVPSEIEQHDEFECNSIKYCRQFTERFLFVLKLIFASGIMKALQSTSTFFATYNLSNIKKFSPGLRGNTASVLQRPSG